MYDDTLPIRLIGIILGTFFILWGLIILCSPSFLSKMIKFGNSLQGVKTKITPTTLRFYRINSFISVIVGTIIIIITLVAK